MESVKTKLPFIPITATEAKIKEYRNFKNGNLYFATDTGRIYLDMANERLSFGGHGVAVLYASGKAADIVEDPLKYYHYTMSADCLVDKNAEPKADDLIINSDGRFFKVISFTKETKKIYMSLIAVSGTGGSSGGSTPGVESNLTFECTGGAPNAQTFIYGQKQEVEFTATAKKDAVVTYIYTITNAITGESKSFSFGWQSSEPHKFDLGSNLYKGLNNLRVSVNTSNSGSANLEYEGINSIVMSLKASDNFNPLNYAYNSNLTFYAIPVGAGINKTLKVYLDNELAASENYSSTVSDETKGIDVPKRDHGVYNLKAVLSHTAGISEITTDPLEYEVAFVDSTKTDPLIWFKPYPKTIVDHDKLTLEFMVYDPVNKNGTTVQRYENNKALAELDDIVYSQTTWITWNISNYEIGKNTFSIKCGNTSRDVVIYVEEDKERNLEIINAGLYLNLDTLGRSNKENKTSRETWEYKHPNGSVTAVKFNNFNWYNNGWLEDAEINNSILRISNGASIDIPLSIMNTKDLSDSLTFEIRFRLRNVQKYENLIKIESEVIGKNEFNEDIVKVTKTVSSTEGVWGKYYNNNIGMCLGTQEGFFKGSSAIASGRYKEDQIVTVSFVVEAKTPTNPYPLIYMYIDGVMCSIIEYNKSSEEFNSLANAININSDYCDVDLLGVRVYKAGLTSNEIVQNYLADQNDAVLYDMNQIVKFNEATNLPSIDYNMMLTYNTKHPDQLLQPYAVLECVDKTEDKLPFVKDGVKMVNVTFVNPSLDKAYKDNLITDEEYLCGAPSFQATNIEFDVQGTSSQGYPRRNYKCKFKKKNNNSWTYTDGPLKGKEIGEKNSLNNIEYKGFYMDNTYSETTFTWKADYMESSMTHNTGFASFVNTLYDFHPLQNYDSNIDVTNRRTTIYGFPIIVFQKTSQVDSDGDPIYEFIGRYNFNLDKGCNNVIGFEDKHAHPYVDGTFVDGDTTKPLDFAHIAECWELKHNQGGRVAFNKAQFSEVDANNNLTVLSDFEVRYNYYKDDIENAQLGLEDWEPKSKEERNAFLLERYRNLEKVTEWLVSTDTTPVSAQDYVPVELPEPVTYGSGDFAVTYTHDTRDYRIAKFKNEFTKHFNTHYCAIYFIMTEFLIQYDSRGKNMMLGSWGPQERGGEYIWYPIFYDIDTQLGVNNSGVPSWEYYNEPTRLGNFSTSSSVLWNNFYECYYDTIVDTYVRLRKNNLTYEKLNGYYSYDPAYILYTGKDGKQHNSYAMKGNRPINIINIDQYYKYIAPTFSGYINTSGGISKDEGKRFYCLQGNRNLHRELFLRNRFNFVDSLWLGGSYAIEAAKQEFQIRTNANKYAGDGALDNTSDKYLTRNPSDAEKQIGFIHDPDGSNALNADWTWDIVPYLQQYVSIYYDEVLQRNPIQYTGDGNAISVRYRDDKEKEIRETPNFGQQLTYMGGAQYISSLGDISLKYPDEIYLTGLKRLKDIRLGNDYPGYSNNALTTCILGAGSLDAEGKPNDNAKSLLESVVLTGVNSLSGTIDITGSEKLKEFRALNTNISGATFASGVQAEVIHLPKTTTFIDLVEPTALRNILTSSAPSGVDEKTGYNTYPSGLYVEGVTDSSPDNTTLINRYSVTGGTMGYSSYELLQKLINIKKQMQENPDLNTGKYSKTLAISLKDVDWTPYRLVGYGEEVDLEKTYKKATENSTLVNYVPDSNWSEYTLNELIYEVDPEKEAQKAVISNLDMLDLFLDENNNLNNLSTNYFQDTIENEDGSPTYPNITGNIYVANDSEDPISDYVIRTKYNVKYPKLTIFADNIDSAYTAKFIDIDPDTNQHKVVDTIKYQKVEGARPTLTTETPSRLHHDFVGWSRIQNPVITDDNGILDPDKVAEVIITEDKIKELLFSAENPTYTFYAVFYITNYTIEFYDKAPEADDYYFETVILPYGSTIVSPLKLPYRKKEESKLPDYHQTLIFKGWTDNEDNAGEVSADRLQKVLVNLNDFSANRDNHKFYAVFIRGTVYDIITDYKYFTVTNGKIGVKDEYRDALSGKITLPAKDENGNYITGIATNGFSNMPYLTHVFFEQDNNIKYESVDSYSFYRNPQLIASSLEVVELPNSIRTIGINAFRDQGLLTHVTLNDEIHTINEGAFYDTAKLQLDKLPAKLTTLGVEAFCQCGLTIEDTETQRAIPSGVTSIPFRCFARSPGIKVTQFGSDDPEYYRLSEIGDSAFSMPASNSGAHKLVKKIDIYSSIQSIGASAFKDYGEKYDGTDGVLAILPSLDFISTEGTGIGATEAR